MPDPKMTLPVQAVLQVLLAEPGREVYGFELAKASGLASGTVYPIVTRLIAAGWVDDRWEDPEVGRAEGRPPRRYFRLTGVGEQRAVNALQRAARRRGITLDVLTRPTWGGATP